jgi:hypothetical protein
MTVVTGSLGGPVVGTKAAGLVTFYIVDSEFRRVRNARRADGTIVEDSRVDLTAGAYSATLTPQVDVVFPEGSRTARQYMDRVEYLVVPDTGTHGEQDIAVQDPTVAPAPVVLTSIVDQAVVTSGTSPLSVVFTALTAVPNTSVTVPDLDQTVVLEGHGPMKPTATGSCAMAIGPAGNTTLGSQIETYWLYYAVANLDQTAVPKAYLAPHTPGDYQLYFYGVSGTILFDVSASTKGSLTATAI